MKLIEKKLAGIALASLCAGYVLALITDFNTLQIVLFTLGYASLLALIMIFMLQTKSTLLKVILCFMALSFAATYFDIMLWPFRTFLLILELGTLILPVVLIVNLKTQRFEIPHFYSGLIALLYVMPIVHTFFPSEVIFVLFQITPFLMTALIGSLLLKKHSVDSDLKRVRIIVLVEDLVLVIVRSFEAVQDVVKFFVS